MLKVVCVCVYKMYILNEEKDLQLLTMATDMHEFQNLYKNYN